MHSKISRPVSNRPWLRLLGRASMSMLVLLSAPAAHSAVVICEAGAASIPVLDPLSTSAAVGDFTLACSGGVEMDPLPRVNFQAFFNVPLLQTVTPILTDGVNDYSGIFTGSGVVFLAIPLNPVASSFAIQQIFVNPSLQAEGFEFIAFLSASSEIAVAIRNPIQTVAVNGSVAAAVPEPSTGLLLASASAAAMLTLRQRRAAVPR
jgi:PEP-CTERM motif-containing protein